MTIKLLIALILMSASFLSDAMSHTKYITYHNNGDVFILRKKCIENLSLKENLTSEQDKISYSIYFIIKKESACTKGMNNFFRRNIGSYVVSIFDEKYILTKSKVVSMLKVDRGFSQYVPDKNLADKIIINYSK